MVRPGLENRGAARHFAVTVPQTGFENVTDAPTPPSPIVAGLLGRCPRCGKGRLFQGFLTLRPRCESCDLDFSFVDSADGPAFFVMFFSGFIVAGSALAVEILYAPPYWVHALLWGPLILITAVLPLRPVKGLLIALQYHNKAEEGRFTGGEAP